ncbi:MAG: M14 family zinc carboxypeptidase [Pseudomarimonas sp.]
MSACMLLLRSACLGLLIAASASAQVIQTYTQTQTGANLRPLGYRVPIPVQSLTPVEGFRTYDSLNARLQALALESADIAAHQVGTTFNGRPMWAYVVSSEGSTDVEGRAKPAFFINATTHAREWAVPEVSVGLIEHMATSAASDGLVRYLLDNTRLVIVPVQNIDGFQQTQRFPTQVVVGQDPDVPNDWPRDGRMRRKNMRGVDEVLTTFNDHLRGIDLNRNHPPFWGTTTQGGRLTDPNNLVFRGSSAHSEPEARAILNAADLGPVSRMRLGIDLHSHSRVFLSSNTGRARLNQIQQRLIQAISAHHQAVPTATGSANDRFYADIPDPPNSGIGTHAEYFAYEWLVPAWTLELEPGELGAREYGGSGESHGGFILPESQAKRVREAWAQSHVVAFYFMAGPPYLQSVSLHAANSSAALLHESRWLPAATGSINRTLQTRSLSRISVGQSITATLGFSKPMRLLANGGAGGHAGRGLPGVDIELQPRVWLLQAGVRTLLDVSQGQWLDSGRYPGTSEAFEFTFVVPNATGEFRLEVETTDMVRLGLDANPATPADWSAGAWSDWNSISGSDVDTDSGGIDSSLAFTAEVHVPGPIPRVLGVLPTVLGEGDLVRVRLKPDAPVIGRVEVIGEDPDFTRSLPANSELSHDAPRRAVWLDGQQGERELVLGAEEDAIHQGDRDAEFRLGLIEGGRLSNFLSHSYRVIDNDRADRRSLNLADYRVAFPAPLQNPKAMGLAEGFAAALMDSTPIDINLRGGATYYAPFEAGRMQPIPVLKNATLFGNGGTVILGDERASPVTFVMSERPGTLFEVGPEGRLTLDQVTIVMSGFPDALLAGEVPAPLFSTLGQLNVSRSVIRDVEGQFAAAFSGTGNTLVERSSVVRWSDSPVVTGAGNNSLRTTSVLGATSPSAVLRGGGSIEGIWTSLIGNSSADARFKVEGTGSLRFTGVLLQDNQSSAAPLPAQPDCVGAITSGGFNLHDASGCVGAGQGDLGGVSIELPDPAPFTDPTWKAPVGQAIDFGGNCPSIDQRGAPRPQTMTPNAAPRCDVGAVEVGINPYRGIWQPTRPGHGLDLQTNGNQLLLAWYTYADNGQPTAYQAIAPLTGPRWQAELQLSRRHPTTGEVLTPVRVGTVAIDFASDVSATLRWRFDARGIDGSEAIVAALFAAAEPEVEVTGLWFPPAESGYGATITRRGDVTAVGLYYYDASGVLRWALGTGGGESAQQIDMVSYTGFCPDCDAATMPVQAQPAGDLLVHFLSPRRARVDTNLLYPGANGGSWIRSRADFVPLNDSVDNSEAAAQVSAGR